MSFIIFVDLKMPLVRAKDLLHGTGISRKIRKLKSVVCALLRLSVHLSKIGYRE